MGLKGLLGIGIIASLVSCGVNQVSELKNELKQDDAQENAQGNVTEIAKERGAFAPVLDESEDSYYKGHLIPENAADLGEWEPASYNLPDFAQIMKIFEWKGELHILVKWPYKNANNKTLAGIHKLSGKEWKLVGEPWPGAPAQSNHHMSPPYINEKNELFMYFSPGKKIRKFTGDKWNDLSVSMPSGAVLNFGKAGMRGNILYVEGHTDEQDKTKRKYSIYPFDTVSEKWLDTIPAQYSPRGPRGTLIVNKNHEVMLAGAGRSGKNCDKDAPSPWEGCSGIDKVVPKEKQVVQLYQGLYNGNATNGQCCAQDFYINANPEGSQVYASNWRDSYKYNFSTGAWTTIAQGSYGNAPGLPIPIGESNKYQLKGKLFIGSSSYHKLGSNYGKVKTGHKILDENNINFNHTNTVTIDGGKTLYSVVRPRGRAYENIKKDINIPFKNTIAKLSLPENPPVFSSSFNPTLSTYLESKGHDSIVGGSTIAGKTIVLAGNFGEKLESDGGKFNVQGGTLLVVNPESQVLENAVTLGGTVSDIQGNNKNQVAVVGAFGVSLYNSKLEKLWTKSLDGAEETLAKGSDNSSVRVSLGNDGNVAVLVGKTVTLFSEIGEVIATKTIEKSWITDLAYSSEAGAVFVSGYQQYNSVKDDNGKTNPVQVALLWKLKGSDLSFEGKTWDFKGEDVGKTGNMADTRAYRVQIGQDGSLYVAGESAGGNTIFRWNGKDLTTAALIKGDPYSDPWNTRSSHIGYFAKVNMETMTVDKGRMILNRLPSNNEGNTFRARAITADKNGYVYIGGTGACCSKGRSVVKMYGKSLSKYAGGESSLLILEPNWKKEVIWTPFVSPDSQADFKKKKSEEVHTKQTGDGGAIRDIVIGDGFSFLVGNAKHGKIVTSDNAFSKEPLNPSGLDEKSDGYLIIWK